MDWLASLVSGLAGAVLGAVIGAGAVVHQTRSQVVIAQAQLQESAQALSRALLEERRTMFMFRALDSYHAVIGALETARAHLVQETLGGTFTLSDPGEHRTTAFRDLRAAVSMGRGLIAPDHQKVLDQAIVAAEVLLSQDLVRVGVAGVEENATRFVTAISDALGVLERGKPRHDVLWSPS